MFTDIQPDPLLPTIMNKLVRKYLITAFSVSLFLGTVIFTLTRDLNYIYHTDFRTFITGAAIIADGKGKALYNVSAQIKYQNNLVTSKTEVNRLLPFMNLPFYAVLFIPALTNPLAAYRFWACIIALSVIAIILIAPKVFPYLKMSMFWPVLIIFWLPYLYSINNIQFSSLLSLILIADYWLIKRGKSFQAGLISGIFLLKIQFLPIIPLLMLLNKKRLLFLAGFLVLFLPSIISCLLISGIDFPTKYISFLSLVDKIKYSNNPANENTFYYTLISLGILNLGEKTALFTTNLLMYLSICLIYLYSLKRIIYDQMFSAAIAIAVTFGVHVLYADLAALSVVTLILLNQINGQNKHFPTKPTNNRYVALTLILGLFLIPILGFSKASYLTPLLLLTITATLLSRNFISE